MGALIRRFLFGLLWFLAFSFIFGAVGGGIAGGRASAERAQSGHPAQGAEQSFVVGMQAGQEFHRLHGGQVRLAAIVCAFVGTVAGILPGTKGKHE
jgi:hypothetical protein